MEILLLPILVLASLSLPFIAYYKKAKAVNTFKKAMIFNLCSFFAVIVLSVVIPFGGAISAEPVETAAVISIGEGLGFIAAALSTGLASLGCGIAVGAAAPAAIGAVAEEPKSFSKSLIFVALGEGIALYGVLISVMILSKL